VWQTGTVWAGRSNRAAVAAVPPLTPDRSSPSYDIDQSVGTVRLLARGNWSVAHIADVDAPLRQLVDRPPEVAQIVLDLDGITRLDTAGAWVLHRTCSGLREKGIQTRYDNVQDTQRLLLNRVTGGDMPETMPKLQVALILDLLGRAGDSVIGMVRQVRDTVGFLGAVVVALVRGFTGQSRLRWVPIVSHMERAGLDAMPLICLLTFLIGAVLAQQGVAQLEAFGAQVFMVNLVTITFLREAGILLTAIIVAGRSGSAFTAEIGSMKMREEIDAMRTLGLDPMEMLVVPRILALVITLPLLTFAADIMGLIGGGVVAFFMLDMTPYAYAVSAQASADLGTFLVGIIKAPFMALAIGLIGCRSGLMVTGSAESVGAQTTLSVVRSIFAVIVLDALFAILFTTLGI